MIEALQGCTIGFIGGGAMAEALIAGLRRAGIEGASIVVAEPRAARREALARDWDVRTTADNAEAAGADLVVLAVKPQQLEKAVLGLDARLRSGATVISVLAGVPVARLRALLGDAPAIVRAMPNTPALVGAGIAALFSEAEGRHRARAEALLGACGEVVWLEDEEQMHAVTAVSGSGPAYLFLLAELMARAGERLGLPAATAERLVRATVLGAGRMLTETGRAPAELRAQVTSPGGTTEAALNVLFERGVPEAVREALAAAARRSRELGGG